MHIASVQKLFLVYGEMINHQSNDEALLTIEVVFALPSRQELMSLTVSPGTTAEMVMRQSAISDLFPEEDFSDYQLGIWGKLVTRSYSLKDGDRLEIYRPLLIDPREARRALAADGRSMGQSGDKSTRESEIVEETKDSD
jgi:putative ubiquitin-RnfH superfamily antitoxin RatB of RatAB toxin-antitoxin module